MKAANGGIVKLNGGGAWRRSVCAAWHLKLRELAWRSNRHNNTLDCRDPDTSAKIESMQSAQRMFDQCVYDMYEDAFDAGELIGKTQSDADKKGTDDDVR